ncbi:MAG: glycosyltransferase family 9 protein [Acidobacteria bacterium]|nr:glycosyltransferase family 9 protein [Acidobacteriota bacterium]
MSPRLPDQGRHPGDADRRSHGRTLKILLVRLRLIGDVVFTTPAITALRQRFPTARISYLVELVAEPVVRGNPHLDEVIVVERPRGWRRLRYDLALAARLRRARFDLVIDFHGGPRSAWLTRATGAARRIGYALPGRGWAYTEMLPWTPALVPPRHSVENQFDLLRPLGIPGAASEVPPVEMAEDAAAATSVARRLQNAGVPADSALVVMHVSAGNPFRRWPAGHFAEVAATLARAQSSRRIIISSGPSERDSADIIAASAQSLAPDVAERILRCGEFDLAELRALVARAALYIGGDSGPMHIAATTTVPIVALFGPTLPQRSIPWRTSGTSAIGVDAGPLPCRPCHQRRCEPGDFRCLTRIEPARVIAAAEQLLHVENSRT